jgi:hypothetical protein
VGGLSRRLALLAASVGAAAVLAPATAAPAPGDPACAPDKTLAVTFESNENGEAAPLVATHEVQLVVDWPDGEVRNPSLSVPQGVRLLGRAPRKLRLIVPDGATLDVTASWEQATDPADPASDPLDPATRCVATTTTALSVTPARPSRVFYDVYREGPPGYTTFAVVPDQEAGDVSPLEVSVRTTRAARFPSPGSKARRMPVALRPSERVRYHKHIPHPDLLTSPALCRFYYLTCGADRVGTKLTALPERDPNRRIRKRDLVGGQPLSRVQPYRQVAPYGVNISTNVYSPPGHEPPALGFDIQVRQSGRLVARVRRAFRCATKRNRYNVPVYQCRTVRRQNG